MSETGITNLGPVPPGVGFYDATVLSRHLRKHEINPAHHSRRLTVCETVREIWREADKPNPDPARIKELAAAAFDYGKRMNGRMVELRGMVTALGGKP